MRSAKGQQALVEAWNAIHPAMGTAVDVRLDGGEIRRTKTRSAAELLGGHTAVIWLDGISGAYLLERVTFVPTDQGDEAKAAIEQLMEGGGR